MRIKNVNTIFSGKIYIFIIFTILISLLTILLAAASVSCSSKNTEPAYNGHLTGDNIPSYTGYFNDYTGKIPSKWVTDTEQLIIELEAKTSCEIGVAFIQDLNGLSVEEYAAILFEKWGIGKKESDNGVLLLASLKDRALRMKWAMGLKR